MSRFAESASGAAAAAVRQCQAQSGAADCRAVNWFHNAVGSFARASDPASDPAYGSGQGWADNVADATKFADGYAVQTCQHHGGMTAISAFG